MSARQQVSPLVTIIVVVVAVCAVGFIGFKLLGGPPRSSDGRPVPTQPNPGGPPPVMSSGGPAMGMSGGYPGSGGPVRGR